jgi:hypothetical protein
MYAAEGKRGDLMADQTLSVGWIAALILGFAASLLGFGRWDTILIFLGTGGMFTAAHLADKTAKDRAERRRTEYEREFGPHLSRRAAEWLKTENGRDWSKLPQAGDFLANRRPDLLN